MKRSSYTNRLGEIKQMNCGDFAKIIEYNGVKNVLVEFQDEHRYTCKTEYWNFARGTIRNPYNKNCYGGYVGVGEYQVSKDKKPTIIYDAWIRMLERSFDKDFKEKYPAYKEVTCCNEWLNFQNFAKWFENHYYEIECEAMEVDKDWIKFGNKIYCSEFCEIVPSIINSCLLNHAKIKYHELPTGITYYNDKYVVRMSMYGKRKSLGHYTDLSNAMKVYKDSKIKYVHELANKYKNYLPEIIYNNMMDFENRFDKEYPEYAKIQ